MKKITEQNRVTTPMIITSLVMLLLFLGLTLLLVTQREHLQTHEEIRKEARLKNLADLEKENEKILTQYHWVDKAKGIVGIPIDRAMNLVLSELQSSRPHPAGPITSPSPAASPSPATRAGEQGQQASATAGQPAPPSATPTPTQPSQAVSPNQPGPSATPQNTGTAP